MAGTSGPEPPTPTHGFSVRTPSLTAAWPPSGQWQQSASGDFVRPYLDSGCGLGLTSPDRGAFHES